MPLHITVIYEHKETGELFLKNGANTDSQNKARQTSLHLATDKRPDGFEPILLSYGVKTDIKDNNGNAPHHLAAKRKSRYVNKADKALDLLVLEYNSPIDMRNNNGDTALHIATAQGNTGNVESLLKAGANTMIKNKDGKIAYQLAPQEAHDLKKLLRSYMPTLIGKLTTVWRERQAQHKEHQGRLSQPPESLEGSLSTPDPEP